MRNLLIIYCAVTAAFVGGCAFLLLSIGETFSQSLRYEPVIYVLLMALAANLIFIVMARSLDFLDGRLMVAAWVIYAIGQTFVAFSIWNAQDDSLQVASLVVLLGLKGFVIFFTSKTRGHPA